MQHTSSLQYRYKAAMLLFFLLVSCKFIAQNQVNAGDLFRRWVSEKSLTLDFNALQDTLVYHYFRSEKAGNIPPDHRYAGFSFGEDGLFLVHKRKTSAEDDSPDFAYGAWYWTKEKKDCLRVVFNNEERYYSVLQLNADQLVLAPCNR